ncbi:MAG: gamma-glutamyltransferase, partial [Micrococcales bacterium]|nr:gamma-glutamyltransferase [Micrococcales bacterium]
MTPRLRSPAPAATKLRHLGVSRRLGLGLAVALAAPLAIAAAPATAVSAGPTAAAPAPEAGAAQQVPARSGRQDHRPGPVGHNLPKVASMTGGGGAVASVDPVASQVGIDVLRRGGNAADAAIATAAALGVVEPYANGIGGGGFFAYYDARSGKVSTIDGRETAPKALHEKSFVQPDGTPMNFDKVVNSGLSVGVPGTPATWKAALDRWGSRSFAAMLEPAQRIAERGFVVDDSFSAATAENAERFAQFPATAKIFLPAGTPVAPGSVLRQPDLARSYAQLRRHGPAAIYRGRLGSAIVATVTKPQTTAGVTVPAGAMTREDLAAYRALSKAPVHSTYRGYDVYGMPVPSSGGIAVAEALNLLQAYEQRTGLTWKNASQAQYLNALAEASATAFADRNRWVGDVAGVPVRELISKGFAAERACGFNPGKAQARPIAFGAPDGSYGACAAAAPAKAGVVNDGQATTHLTVSDKWGTVASYTGALRTVESTTA